MTRIETENYNRQNEKVVTRFLTPTRCALLGLVGFIPAGAFLLGTGAKHFDLSIVKLLLFSVFGHIMPFFALCVYHERLYRRCPAQGVFPIYLAYGTMALILFVTAPAIYLGLANSLPGSGLLPVGMLFLPIFSGIAMCISYFFGRFFTVFFRKKSIWHVPNKDEIQNSLVFQGTRRKNFVFVVLIMLGVIIGLSFVLNSAPVTASLEYLSDFIKDGSYQKEVNHLFADGWDVNTKDDEGKTLLHKASLRSDKRTVQLLIEKGADITAKDNLGRTPLHYAAFAGSPKVAEILLEHGANANEPDSWGDTPLHATIRKDRLATAKVLIDHGAKPDAQNNRGQTPLRVAEYWGYKDMAKILIRAGADVNFADTKGTGSRVR